MTFLHNICGLHQIVQQEFLPGEVLDDVIAIVYFKRPMPAAVFSRFA